LPQKGGFPQENINEIHGSWFDPSNPVVKYSGTLQENAYPWMVEEAQAADLTLVLGTSLGGLNADQVAHTPAKKSLTGRAYAAGTRGGALGTVIINIQQTPHDGAATLRLFGQSDKLLVGLLKHMGMPQPAPTGFPMPRALRVLVPFDAEGKRTTGGRRMWWDLRPKAKIQLADGHNCIGSGQPAYKHIGNRSTPGKGQVVEVDRLTSSFRLEVERTCMRLGLWWLEAAQRGGPLQLPVVNQDPEFEQ